MGGGKFRKGIVDFRIKEIAIPRTKENSLVPFSHLTIKLPLKSIPTFMIDPFNI